jgi:hypothetical protein
MKTGKDILDAYNDQSTEGYNGFKTLEEHIDDAISEATNNSTAIDKLISKYEKAIEVSENNVYKGIYSMFVKELKTLSRAEV